ncbi:hypothetical protein GCM10009616_38540 [Microlunatus lacustris]
MRTTAGTLTALVLALGAGVVSVPLTATPAMAAVAVPHQFSSVASKPGPKPGEISFSWVHDGVSTTGYVIETGLTTFSPVVGSGMALHGRGSKEFTFPSSARSVTLTAAQVASAGAPAASANHLKWRIRAVNRTSAGEAVKWYPSLQVTAVAPAVPAATGTALRVANFNVRTARASSDKQTWMQRVPAVAKSILEYRPDVAALQELGPGRADGQTGSTTGLPRQTDSLLTELARQGGSRYQLTQTTPYVPSGTTAGTQGMRILYDSSKYTMISPCSNTTDGRAYSAACAIVLPLRAGDAENHRRKSVWARFASKATGEKFYFVSVHLDSRSDANLTVDKTYDALRGEQAKTTIAALDKLNTTGDPVILGGDLNTWQNDTAGNTAHEVLVSAGYYDTAAATTQVKSRWTTMNGFKTTLADPGNTFQARLDAVLTQGITGAAYFENVFKNPDDLRPSDHNMVVADVRLPAASAPTPTPTPEPSDYRPVTPTRLVDTRSGSGVPVAAKGTLDVSVTGRAGVPATGVGAVVLNLTSVGAAADGYLTAYPAAEARTTASTLNFTRGTAMANSVVVKVGADGKVRLYGSAATDVLVDVQGWFPNGSDYTALTPARLLDTRSGTGAPAAPVGAKQKIDLVVTGRGGVPATGVGSVVLNLTATDATGSGFVTAYPAGVTRPTASSLNFVPKIPTANGVVLKVGTGGRVSLYVSAGTHLVADVQGWFPSQSVLTGLTPARLLDTRDGTGAPDAAVAAGQGLDLQVTGRGGVPASGVTAVVLNVTATGATSTGFVSARAAGTAATTATDLALVPGRPIATRVIAEVGTGGRVTLSSTARTDLVADVVGYLTD